MADDTSVKTIRMAGEDEVTAHKKIKAYAALNDMSIGEAVVDIMKRVDLEEEITS